MSIQANLIAFDGASTPVQHTLVPLSNSKDPKSGEIIAMYREAITTIPAVAQISAEIREKRLPSGVYQVTQNVFVPVMEAVSGSNASGYTAAPKVAYTNTIKVIGLFHERSTIAERRLVRQLAVNIANGVVTTVTPVTTGAAPELFDSLITPN